jgi:hypothetical protein
VEKIMPDVITLPNMRDRLQVSFLNFINPEQIEKAAFGDPSKFIRGTASQGDPDLGFLLGVLTTEGMNKNGQFFLPSELIKAAKTPILKPFNIEHDSNRIIGVIYDSAVAAVEGHRVLQPSEIIVHEESGQPQVADESGPIEVLIACAIYRRLFPEVYDEFVQSFASDDPPKLSMEVWFNDYLYIVGDKQVARSPETEYLREHVGAEVGDELVGIAFLNMIFGGVASVKSPANVNSVTLAVAQNEHIAEKGEQIDSNELRMQTFGPGDHSHSEFNPSGYHAHTEDEMDIMYAPRPSGKDEDYDIRKDKKYTDVLGGHEHSANNPLGLHKHKDGSLGGPHFHLPNVEAVVYGDHSHMLETTISYASEESTSAAADDDAQKRAESNALADVESTSERSEVEVSEETKDTQNKEEQEPKQEKAEETKEEKTEVDTALQTELADLKIKIQELTESKTALEGELSETKTGLETKTAELEALQRQVELEKRLAKIADVRPFKDDDHKAKVQTLVADMSAEAFATYLETLTGFTPAEAPKVETKTEEEKPESEKAESTSEKEKKDEEKEAEPETPTGKATASIGSDEDGATEEPKIGASGKHRPPL